MKKYIENCSYLGHNSSICGLIIQNIYKLLTSSVTGKIILFNVQVIYIYIHKYSYIYILNNYFIK